MASIDEPPYEMKGSVMPFVGIMFKFTAILMNACWPTRTNRAPAATCSKGSDSFIER